MAKSVVTLNFKTVVDGQEKIGRLTADLGNLNRAVKRVGTNINLASISTAVGQAQQAISTLNGAFSGLVGAYAIQEQAETRLEQAMRNTMGATAEQIQSIKDLCSAQQQAGVIGDEIQLQGAQRLASFVSERESLASLIPVMNDLVAQQYGFNATGENAASIAVQLGKALEGQTRALKSLGITLTEDQAELLKTGTEQQRVSVLTDVITAKVGGMNAALAETPTGKIKQLQNYLGDLKEEAGRVARAIQPALDIAAQTTIAAGGVLKLVNGFKAATAAVAAMGTAARAALITSGIGAAVVAIGVAVNALSGSTKSAAEEMAAFKKSLTDISTASAEYAAEELARSKALYTAATDTTRSMKDRLQAANDLKAAYPDYLANFSAEEIAAGRASAAYGDLTNAIMAAARARAAQDAMVKNETLRLKTLNNLAKAQKQVEREKATAAADTSSNFAGGSYASGNIGLNQVVNTGANLAAIDAAEAKVKELQTKLKQIDAAQKSLAVYSQNAARAAGTVSTPAPRAAARNGSKDFKDFKDLKDSKETPAPEKEAWQFTGNLEELTTLNRIQEAIRQVQAARAEAARDQIQGFNEQIEALNRYREAFEQLPGATAEAADGIAESVDHITDTTTETSTATVNATGTIFQGWDSLKGLGSGVQSMTEALSGNKDAWQTTVGVIDSAMQIYQSIAAIIQLVTMLSAALGVQKQTEAAQTVAAAGAEIGASMAAASASGAEATADTTAAAAKTMKAHASIPFAGIAIAAGMIAAMVAIMASLPKFADGGVAYGPTLGLFGEYPGARSNPEVVAPLDRLRSLLGDTGNAPGRVRFTIEGRTLVGILEKENTSLSRR